MAYLRGHNIYSYFFFLFSFLVFSQEKDSIQQLEGVIVVKKDPISEKYSVKKISQLDIYFNPASKADPLLAVNTLPASTNTSETASPTLRGGDADRSRVVLNGTPILNPVRNSQLDGYGNFSLFNTEIIEKMYVYASNPPLLYGNSTAGLVEIETQKKLETSSLFLIAGLANVGFMANQKLSKDSFFQVYGNYMFSDAFIDLNKKNIPHLNAFSSKDFGLNAHFYLNKNWTWNTFHYLISEDYDAKHTSYNVQLNMNAKSKRYFTVNNLDFSFNPASHFRFSSLIDMGNKDLKYGVINSADNSFKVYNALDYKWQLNSTFTLQIGGNYFVEDYDNKGRNPVYYYLLQPDSPSYYRDIQQKLQMVENYVYANWEINNQWGVSAAARKNIPLDEQKSYLSYQFSSHFELNRKNRFIFAAGKYYSYSTPDYYLPTINLLSDSQISLDYYYETKKLKLNAAVYYKEDKGDFKPNDYEIFDASNAFGIEFSANYSFSKKLSFYFSNIYLNKHVFNDDIKYNSKENLSYLVKTGITYMNPKLFTASVYLNAFPGNHYTEVVSSSFMPELNAYAPVFSAVPNNAHFASYNKIDFTANRFVPFKQFALLFYFTLSNVLNSKNQSHAYYNEDYSTKSFDYYGLRTVYFGMQFRFYDLFKKNNVSREQ